MNAIFAMSFIPITSTAIKQVAADTSSCLLTDSDNLKIWGPIVVGLCAAILVFVAQLIAIWFQNRQFRKQNDISRDQLELQKTKDEREDILKRLNSFYGPIRALRFESLILYRRFGLSLKADYRQKRERFRTLLFLLKGEQLGPQDRKILDQIITINDRILSLIEGQSGVVDTPELQFLLGKLGAHIRVLKLASERKITGPEEVFKDEVFPLAIDGAIESAILRLQDRLKELNISAGQREPVVRDVNSTIGYYDLNAMDYAAKTVSADLSHLCNEFLAFVPFGGRILDAGCGSGRDTRYFIEHGYPVISFDASEGMVKKCREYPHAYCLQMSFQEVAFDECFDGIWACASLLHLPFEDSKLAVEKLVTALRPGGVIFVSVRKQVNAKESETIDGRFFEYYTEAKLTALMSFDYRLEPPRVWETKSNLKDDSGLWVNAIARRRDNVSV
jgi:SAM-dependent methyltransferase